MRLKLIVSQILAVAQKEIKLNFRFKYNYFLELLLRPIRLLALFFIVYSGFFYRGSAGIGDITKENYIIFLALGALMNFYFLMGFDMVSLKFRQEKFWRTIQAIFISPVNKLSLIFGIGLSELVRLVFISVILILPIYVLIPVSGAKFLLIILVIMLIYFGIIGISFIEGAFWLTNENYVFIFKYFFWGWGFISCFYYPIEALPEFIHPLVLANPVYHALLIIRNLWTEGYVQNIGYHLGIVLGFVVISLSLGSYIFSSVTEKREITGY